MRRRGRPPTTTAKVAGGKRSSSNLGNQVLALATGKTQQQIAAACKGARPNHVAPPFPATSGRAASKSAMGNSTPYSQRARSNRPRSDTGIKGAGRLPRNRWFESCSLQRRVRVSGDFALARREKRARYCIIFVSKEYRDRKWTVYQARSAQARAPEERGNEYILPIRVDDIELEGLLPTIGYVPLNAGIERIGEMLVKKLLSPAGGQ